MNQIDPRILAMMLGGGGNPGGGQPGMGGMGGGDPPRWGGGGGLLSTLNLQGLADAYSRDYLGGLSNGPVPTLPTPAQGQMGGIPQGAQPPMPTVKPPMPYGSY